MTRHRKVIFLDFDGVLHPSICDPEQYFSKMPTLEAVLRDTNVGIVVSSSWRFHHAWSTILFRFPKSLRRLVLGQTGEPVPGRHARWHEIRAYRERHGVTDWCALDDSAFEFPPKCSELVLCNGATGLVDEQAEILGRWLGN